MHYTYVLVCKLNEEGKLYIGSTDDLKSRLLRHKSKSVKTTRSFDTVSLVYYEACNSKTDARKRELQLKTGFGRGYLKNRLKNDKLMRA